MNDWNAFAHFALLISAVGLRLLFVRTEVSDGVCGAAPLHNHSPQMTGLAANKYKQQKGRRALAAKLR